MALAPVPQTVARRRWFVVFAVFAVRFDPILGRLQAIFGDRGSGIGDRGERIKVRGSRRAVSGSGIVDRGAVRLNHASWGMPPLISLENTWCLTISHTYYIYMYLHIIRGTEMNQLTDIKRVYKVIDSSLFNIKGTLDYDRVTDAVIKLAGLSHTIELLDDGYELWDIGEGGECALADFIIGAYWHYSEYHSGQSSKGYYALSLLGMVFDPNMTEMDNDSPEFHAYQSLNELAAQYDPRPRLVP